MSNAYLRFWGVRGSYSAPFETHLGVGGNTSCVEIRMDDGQNKDEENLLDYIPKNKYTLLPKTAGCFDADSAVRTCRLARELLNGYELVKLEVLGDTKTLYPDIPATLEAAKNPDQRRFQGHGLHQR